MSFWKKAIKVGSAVGGAILDEVQKQAEDRQRKMGIAEEKAMRVQDDRELVSKFQNSSGIEKVAYASELEKRGYLAKNSEGKFERTTKTL